MRKHILVVAFLLAAGIDASAQEFSGSIYGRIVDPANAIMPGVSITVEGAAIQGQRTVASEANGSYRVLFLPQVSTGSHIRRPSSRRSSTKGPRSRLARPSR